MAVESTIAVKPVDAPPLSPLPLKCRLAPTPKQAPKYSVTIRNAAGEGVLLADPQASRALVALMNVHAVNGGAACHWGGPAGFAEIIAAMHGLMFRTTGRQWHEAFNFVNDAGHAENGIYALRALYGFDGLTFEDLKGFRSILSKLTGHGESHINPEGILLSNGPLGSALPQAQGLAMADKLIGNDRVTLVAISDGASMEGEAKESFSAVPGLAAKGRMNPFVVLISDNDTKLSGRISKDAFSMGPSLLGIGALGWEVIDVANGNNLQEVYLALENAVALAKSNPAKPVCLRLKTIKGFGVKATMESASGGHGFPLANGEKIVEFVDEIFGGQTPPELAGWANALRTEWEQKESAKKSQSIGACFELASREKRQGPNRPGQSRNQGRPGRLSGLLHLLRRPGLDGHQPIPKKFSGPLGGSGHRRGQHDQRGGGLCQKRPDTHCGHLRAIRCDQGQFAPDHGRTVPGPGHRNVLACGVSGCRRWGFASGDHLFCCHKRHPTHGSDRAQLFG